MAGQAALADIPVTPRDHFRVNFHAAVYHVVDHLRRSGRHASLDALFGRHPFLASYLEAAAPLLPESVSWDAARQWWAHEIGDWEGRAGAGELPLLALETHTGGGFTARLALLIAGLVDEDSRFGGVFAELSGSPGIRRPSVEAVGAILAPAGPREAAEGWALSRTLLDAALVEVPNRADPRSDWLLQVPPGLWDALRGDERPDLPAWACHVPAGDAARLGDLVLPAEFSERLQQVPALLRNGTTRAVVLRGRRGEPRDDIVAALAAELGRGTVRVEAGQVPDAGWPRVGPLCAALGALPVLTFDLAPGDSAELPALPGYRGPVGVVLGPEGGVGGDALESAVPLELPPARAADRRRRWEAALDGHAVQDLGAIAGRFHLPGRHISRAAQAAMTLAALDGRDVVTIDDVQGACRTLNRQLLDTLATHLDGAGGWDRLIVGDVTYAKLAELEARCRHREDVLDHVGPGFGSQLNKGVRALFTGSSGTGKTLAARILGAELGLDVYRVDLAAVVNKYVGETEKNLHRVLSTAEELDVLLLIDEGDALLGNRTAVRTANDRFANLETNYLLQRLEGYQGIVVVTTNASEHIDPAFQRRMDVVVTFVEPGPRERWEIWQLHLPAGHQVDDQFLETVSTRSTMTGGQIRNAALHATLLAVDDGGVVGRHHVEAAVAGEYQKAGALSPFDPSGRAPRNSRARAFLEALS